MSAQSPEALGPPPGTGVLVPSASVAPAATQNRLSSSRETTCEVQLGALLGQFLTHIVDYRGYAVSTAAAYERDCQAFIEFRNCHGLGLNATDVTTPEVRLFLASLGHLSPNSVRRVLYALSSFFQDLEETGIVAHNPVAPVEPPKRRRTLPKMPNRHQCQQIVDACETLLDKALVGLLLLAGLRRGEVLGLEVADVAADLTQLRIDGKGGRERVVPVSTRLRKVLKRYLDERDSDDPALIVNTEGRRMSVTTFYRIFRRILKRAGLADSGITPHHLRHAFASGLVQAGVAVVTVSELLGHSNIATTSIYLHATADSKREAVEKLPFAQPTATTREAW